MHGPNRGPIPHRYQRPLLSVGERVAVEVIEYASMRPNVITGAIAGYDEMGILIDREGGGSVFIPWTSVSTVTKLTA